MSTSRLPEGVSVYYDAANQEVVARIPKRVIYARHQVPDETVRDVIHALAEPGPILREVRARIARNNRRRFGP